MQSWVCTPYMICSVQLNVNNNNNITDYDDNDDTTVGYWDMVTNIKFFVVHVIDVLNQVN